MFEFNRSHITQALQRLVDFRGQPRFGTAEEVSPVIVAGDLLDSPYLLNYGHPFLGSTDAAAVVGENPVCWLRADPTQVVQILKVWLRNGGAAAIDVWGSFMSAATEAALGASSTGYVRDMNPDLGTQSTSTSRSTLIRQGTQAAFSLDPSTLILRIPAGEQIEVEFPKPGILLNGARSVGVCFAFASTSTNHTLSLSVYGKEWPAIR